MIDIVSETGPRPLRNEPVLPAFRRVDGAVDLDPDISGFSCRDDGCRAALFQVRPRVDLFGTWFSAPRLTIR
jgi:hypothetical protein